MLSDELLPGSGGRRRLDLGEVPALVREVVFHQELQGYGCVVSNRARRLEAIFRDTVHDSCKDLVRSEEHTSELQSP